VGVVQLFCQTLSFSIIYKFLFIFSLGWDEALLTDMKVGGKRDIVIPPELGELVGVCLGVRLVCLSVECLWVWRWFLLTRR
jgi:hypothetical protein